MIGGASLRMSPGRSKRHESSIASEFMKQMRIKSEAQQRFKRSQMGMTRSMQTRLRQDMERKHRQTAAYQERICRVRGRVYNGTAKLLRSSTVKRPRSAVTNKRWRLHGNSRLTSGQGARKVYVPSNCKDQKVVRRRPASAGRSRSDSCPQWQLHGFKIGQQAILQTKMRNIQQETEKESRKRARPKSADPRGRRSEKGMNSNAPTIVPAYISPRSARIKGRPNRLTRKRPQSAGLGRATQEYDRTSRRMIQHVVEKGTPAPITSHIYNVQKSIPSKLVIPTAGFEVEDNRGDKKNFEGLTYDEDFNPKVLHSSRKDSDNAKDAKHIAADDRSEIKKAILSPRPPPQKMKPVASPFNKTPPRISQQVSLSSLLKGRRQHTKETASRLHAQFAQQEFSALMSNVEKVAPGRSWHINALQLLTFAKRHFRFDVTLSQCQALLTDCPIESWIHVFDHTTWVSINNEGDARSSHVCSHEATNGGDGFYLDYNRFRERFWEPINKKLKVQFSRLKAAKFDLQVEIKNDRSEPEPAWEPMSLLNTHDGERRENSNLVAMCEQQLKQCRQLRRLYISIRRCLKRRHKSCAVAFSSFKLATDPIVTLEVLEKAIRKCAPQVLASGELHIPEHDFISAMLWLAQHWIEKNAYSFYSFKGKITGKLETRSFFQWMCLGQYSDTITMPV